MVWCGVLCCVVLCCVVSVVLLLVCGCVLDCHCCVAGYVAYVWCASTRSHVSDSSKKKKKVICNRTEITSHGMFLHYGLNQCENISATKYRMITDSTKSKNIKIAPIKSVIMFVMVQFAV